MSCRFFACWLCSTLVFSFIPEGVHAVELPTPYSFDAGPLGKLEISGGADGYVYGLTGAGSDTNKGLLGTSTNAGAEFLNGLVELQKSEGLVQFTFEAGGVNSLTLGTRPKDPTAQKWSTGPFRSAYITIAPSQNLTISAGQIGSLEGYESGIDWKNFNMLTTALWDVENAQSVGVTATYTYGPFAGSITFSDGFDTNVWNYLQLLASYTANDDNSVTLFGATNLGSTGLGAKFYGSATRPYSSSTVAAAGAANLVNSSVVGGYYSFTPGNLTIVPEVQYVWSTRNPGVGLNGYSSHFGAALFVNYKINASDFSIGGWFEYFTSNGTQGWFLNPGAQGVGLAAGPTWSPGWAKKHLFVRGDVGALHLITVGTPGSSGYGSSGTGRNQAIFLVEAGVLF
ncbi:MAG TPA: outer membrane beta-barrel protein [Acetobacteraceae bacterium]|nr:outer membrane beta-barrel protein [Acetobacteraceae bacterium]